MRTLSEREPLHIRRLVWRNDNDNDNGPGIATAGYWILDIGVIDWVFVSFVCTSLGFRVRRCNPQWTPFLSST